MPQDRLISIIDDDDAVRAAIENLVRSLGFCASPFASAEEFLNSPKLGETSCVITDVHMPGMTGVELQSYLLARGYNVPMIFITAFPEDKMCERVRTSGAAGFLSKPFDGGAMIQCINKALGRNGNATGH